MPNWCYNTLHINGNAETIKDFVSKTFVNTKDEYDNEERLQFTFNLIVPMPQELDGISSPLRKNEGETEEDYKLRIQSNIDKYGAPDWYDWRLKNWNCKWDARTNDIEMGDTKIQVSFDTAWSPPMGFYTKMAEMFPTLEFECYITEESDDYAYYWYSKDGQTDIIEGSYKYTDEDGKDVECKDGKWYYKDTDTEIDDEDFYPMSEPIFHY